MRFASVLLLPLFLCLVATESQAQSIGGACSTAGSLTLIGSSSPGELLYCSGTTWGLAEAVTSSGLIGIGNPSPGALLDIGVAGATLGTVRLEGNTSGYVQIQT